MKYKHKSKIIGAYSISYVVDLKTKCNYTNMWQDKIRKRLYKMKLGLIFHFYAKEIGDKKI